MQHVTNREVDSRAASSQKRGSNAGTKTNQGQKATPSKVSFGVSHQDSNESAYYSTKGSFTQLPDLDLAIEEGGEDLIDGPESEAFETFRDYFPKLIEAMVSDIETCAIHLYSRRMINASVRDTVMNPTIGGTLKAVQVLSYVERQIKQYGDDMVEKFAEALKCCSQCIADVGQEISDSLKKCNHVDTPASNVPPTSSHPEQIQTQTSAPTLTNHGDHHEDYSSFYQKKYGSFPGAMANNVEIASSSEPKTYNGEFGLDVGPRPNRTASMCSLSEEDLLSMTENLTNQFQRLSQRHEKRITKVLKEKEAVQKELEFMEHRNRLLNQDLLLYRKSMEELEEYKKLAAQSSSGCKNCQQKDKLLEIERAEYEAKLENLNTQVSILLKQHQNGTTDTDVGTTPIAAHDTHEGPGDFAGVAD